MENRITDICCKKCGGITEFDIRTQRYVCGYCGSHIDIEEARKEKQGFRKILSDRFKDSVKKYRFFTATCSGCGAKVSFEENEALSECPFCGKSMVRGEYLMDSRSPEAIIPFGVTLNEAKDLLKKWCDDNKSRKEGRLLSRHIDELKGFYLPYELIRGPVHMSVSRMDGGNSFDCEGFIRDGFVNRSKQFDNLLLDGMEPFDLDGLKEFEVGYIAGQRVKISDISDKELSTRLKRETEETYKPSIRKVLETKAIDVLADISSAFSFPVLLPVYYISDGELTAAVNGQTGKVSVRAMKDSHYYFLPWWIKAIVATLLFSAFFFGAFRLFGMNIGESICITGILAMFFIIVILCLYSDTTRNSFRMVSGRKIYTSKGNSFTRNHGELVLRDDILEKKVYEPVFFEDVDGGYRPVVLRFTTLWRVIRMILICALVIFFPVIIALFVNGFNFSKINLGGSAVWFCIFVPVVPIYLLKFGIVELYERPWVYTIDENGRMKRHKEKIKIKITKTMITDLLRIMFIPPASLAFWFGLLSFIVIIY
ncbi:MAG: hypothetical protein IKX97_06635, partial [Erysipelotrichaceae bacterium]|nr:hypothetical protein [Erysipelotrichaceae bacterium]